MIVEICHLTTFLLNQNLSLPVSKLWDSWWEVDSPKITRLLKYTDLKKNRYFTFIITYSSVVLFFLIYLNVIYVTNWHFMIRYVR